MRVAEEKFWEQDDQEEKTLVRYIFDLEEEK